MTRVVNEKKVYKNVLSQILPLQLESRSLSVPPRACFDVFPGEYRSRSLVEAESNGFVRMIEKEILVKEDEDNSIVVDEGKQTGNGHNKHISDDSDVQLKNKTAEQDDDTLTSTTKMMESEEDVERQDVGTDVDTKFSGKKKKSGR